MNRIKHGRRETKDLTRTYPSMIGFSHEDFLERLKEAIEYHGYLINEISTTTGINKHRVRELMNGCRFTIQEVIILTDKFGMYE